MKKILALLFGKILGYYHIQKENDIRKQFNLDLSVRFDGLSLEGNVEIGSHTYFNSACRVDSGSNSRVFIGKHCAIGRWVHITSKTHSLEFPTTAEDNPMIQHHEADVLIGNYVWIGDHVYVGPGVTIGDYAIIGANSVVIKDVKPFEIVGGVPARHIRFNSKHRRYTQ